MTLDLDERYRLITLAILHRMLDLREQGGVAPPLTDVRIQKLAREWWPQGFAEDGSLGAFQGLLQEMVGLGVLLQSGERYAIRSSRIAAMLGGKEQIDRQLLELSEKPAPATLDTGSLRRLDPVGQAPAPLTYRQESLLLDWERRSSAVFLTLSSKALGLDELSASLAQLPTEDLKVFPRRYATARQLEAALDEVARTAKQARRCLAVLNGPWLGQNMVDKAAAVAATRKGARGLRILLVPQTADWDAADAAQDGKLWGAELLTLSPLGPTGLRQWLKANDGPETDEALVRLRSWTGGFAALFARLPRTAARDIVGDKGRAGALQPSISLGELGLDDERLLKAARVIVEFDVRDEFAKSLAAMDVPQADKAVEHLERLGVLERTFRTEPILEVNPLVRRVLTATA